MSFKLVQFSAGGICRIEKTKVSTMQSLPFEEINDVMDDSPIQHYVSSLHGSITAEEVVLLDIEVELTDSLCLKVVTILRKQESPSSGFLVNFYVTPRPNGILLPHVSVSRKRKYIAYPSDELIQTSFMSVLGKERLSNLAYLIGEADILSGRKTFGVSMVDFFCLPSFECRFDCRTIWRSGSNTLLSEPHATNLVYSMQTSTRHYGGSQFIEPHFNMSSPQDHRLFGIQVGLLYPSIRQSACGGKRLCDYSG
jgi:hypothetical protein